MARGILERLAEGPVLGDGGYLLELEKRGYVQAGPFTPEVVIEHPDALAQLHREFLRAGAEVLQTMTFYASDDKLATVGWPARSTRSTATAVKVAREVASEGDALVAGNLSLTWAYCPSDAASADHVRELFDRQLRIRLDAGPPDFWIGETFSYLGEALLFVERAKATGLPVMVTMSFEQPVARSYEGDTPGGLRPKAQRRRRGHRRRELPERSGAAAADRARDAFGRRRVRRRAAGRRTGRAPSTPTSPRRRASRTGSTRCSCRARRWAEYARAAKEGGIDYIGSCCGSIQAHVRAMGKAIGKTARTPNASGRAPPAAR